MDQGSDLTGELRDLGFGLQAWNSLGNGAAARAYIPFRGSIPGYHILGLFVRTLPPPLSAFAFRSPAAFRTHQQAAISLASNI